MDDIDRKLLAAIQANPQRSITDLAGDIGLSHTPCWRRLRKLEESGAIRERAVILDPAALDLTVSVFAEVRLKQHDESTLEAFEQQARERPEIMECFSMSGQYDYIMRVVVRNVADYEVFLKKVLLHLEGVGSVNSSFALNCIKLSTRLPI